MFEDLIKRENEVFKTIQKFLDAKLDFVIIGGYAVSAFKHRFSVDADIVISPEDAEKFEAILKEGSFKKTIEKELEKARFVRYEKSEPKISVDLLVNAISVRQTGASFEFELIKKNSKIKKIIGTEQEIAARIPIKELLIVLKIHSGRLTDFRDVAALAKDIDIEIIKKFLFRGNKNKIMHSLKKLNEIVETKEFIDSFKGVFVEKKFDIDLNLIKKICKIK